MTRFLRDDGAAVAVEYAVMLLLILMGILAAIGAVGANSGGMWGGIVSRFTSSGVGT